MSVITGIIRRLEKLERATKRLGARDALQVTSDPILRLTGLRGYWPMSAFDDAGNAADLAGFDAAVTELTYNGNPVYNYDGLAPYIRLDGIGDWLNHVDAAHYDIEGDESYVGVPGLTLGGWFYIEDDAGDQVLMGKYPGAPGNRSYWLAARGTIADDPAEFRMGDDGTNTDAVQLVGYSVDTWHFIAGRFDDADAGQELKVWIDNTTNTAATARNTIFDGNADFTIGALSGGGSWLLTGRASHCWLCAAALSDECIHAIFQQQRSLFGV